MDLTKVSNSKKLDLKSHLGFVLNIFQNDVETVSMFVIYRLQAMFQNPVFLVALIYLLHREIGNITFLSVLCLLAVFSV